jgi:hypothetical protein
MTDKIDVKNCTKMLNFGHFMSKISRFRHPRGTENGACCTRQCKGIEM